MKIDSVKNIPSDANLSELRGPVYKHENVGTFGIADNDALGTYGGTIYYAVVEEDRFMRAGSIPISFITKIYFRITDKLENVHPLVTKYYKIAQSNMINV